MNIRQRLRSEKGSISVVFLSVMCLFIIWNVIVFSEPIFKYLHADYLAKKVVNEIEEEGAISNYTTSLIADLKNEFGFNNPGVVFDIQVNRLGGTEIYNTIGNRSFQLRERFEVRVYTEVRLVLSDLFFGAFTFNMPITATARGVGQRYWRPSELY